MHVSKGIVANIAYLNLMLPVPAAGAVQLRLTKVFSLLLTWVAAV